MGEGNSNYGSRGNHNEIRLGKSGRGTGVKKKGSIITSGKLLVTPGSPNSPEER